MEPHPELYNKASESLSQITNQIPLKNHSISLHRIFSVHVRNRCFAQCWCREKDNLLVDPRVSDELVRHSGALFTKPESNLLLGRFNRVTSVADVSTDVNGAAERRWGVNDRMHKTCVDLIRHLQVSSNSAGGGSKRVGSTQKSSALLDNVLSC